MTRTRKTRRRTNIHGLTSDLILETLRNENPKAIEVRRHGDVFRVLWGVSKRVAAKRGMKSNQRGIWQAVGEFDQFRLTADGRLTLRAPNARRYPIPSPDARVFVVRA